MVQDQQDPAEAWAQAVHPVRDRDLMRDALAAMLAMGFKAIACVLSVALKLSMSELSRATQKNVRLAAL